MIFNILIFEFVSILFPHISVYASVDQIPLCSRLFQVNKWIKSCLLHLTGLYVSSNPYELRLQGHSLVKPNECSSTNFDYCATPIIVAQIFLQPLSSGGSKKFWWGNDKIYKHKLCIISKFRTFMINVLYLTHTCWTCFWSGAEPERNME